MYRSLSRQICHSQLRQALMTKGFPARTTTTASSSPSSSSSTGRPSLLFPLPHVTARQTRLQSTSRPRFTKSDSTIQRAGVLLQEGWEKRWESPLTFTLSLAFIGGTTALLVYVLYDRVARVEPALSVFPREVAAPLRRAIYFTKFEDKPTEALMLLREAIVIADRIGMHPFSDEVLGIRLRAVDILLQYGMTKAAVEVLENADADCRRWVEEGRRRQTLEKKERDYHQTSSENTTTTPSPPSSPGQAEKKNEEESSVSERGEYEQPQPWRKELINEEKLRDRVAKKIIGIKLKLAELHAPPSSAELNGQSSGGNSGDGDDDKRRQALESAVEYCLAEMRHRTSLHKPLASDSGSGYLNAKEISSTMNDLATYYAEKEQHEYAMMLFMQSLSLLKQDEGPHNTTCAQVVLLNNVSSQMVEQILRGGSNGPSDSPSYTSGNATSGVHGGVPRDQTLIAAIKWAEKAIEVAAHIKEPVRTEECDMTCVAALYNLGEIHELQKDFQNARRRYQEAAATASKMGYEAESEMAQAGMNRITTSNSKTSRA